MLTETGDMVGVGDGEGVGVAVGLGVGVGVGVGLGAAPEHGSVGPMAVHPLDHRYHCESLPNA